MEPLSAEQVLHRLEHSRLFPFDAPDSWWALDEPPILEPADWAIAAARAVVADLMDRRGIKREFEKVEDEATRAEIIESLARIIRAAQENQ